MRISADRRDPDFPGLPIVCATRVTLDGELLRDVISADDEQGLVVVIKRDAAGKLMRVGGRSVTETKRGRVEIAWPERFKVKP